MMPSASASCNAACAAAGVRLFDLAKGRAPLRGLCPCIITPRAPAIVVHERTTAHVVDSTVMRPTEPVGAKNLRMRSPFASDLTEASSLQNARQSPAWRRWMTHECILVGALASAVSFFGVRLMFATARRQAFPLRPVLPIRPDSGPDCPALGAHHTRPE
jgi:hypothetical protein